jgi:hypothetical protein
VSLAKDPKYKILQIKLESFQIQVVFLKGTFLPILSRINDIKIMARS